MYEANVPAEYPHSVPKCQVCGRIGPWTVEPVLLPHHIIIFIVLLLAFFGGLIYLVIVLIIRSSEDSRAKICPHCGSKNMHTFVYADPPGGLPYSAGQYGAQAPVQQLPAVGVAYQAPSPSATVYNPSGAAGGSRSAVVYANGVAARTLVLTPGARYTLGRSSENSVQLNEGMVSGKHGVFEVTGDGRLMYRDVGSTNGTFMNGQQLTDPVEIHVGDILMLGGENMRVMVSM